MPSAGVVPVRSSETMACVTKLTLKKGATVLKVDERAHVIARRDPASDQFVAREIVVLTSKAKGPKP